MDTERAGLIHDVSETAEEFVFIEPTARAD